MNNILYENEAFGVRVTHFEEKNYVLYEGWGDHTDEDAYKASFEKFLKIYPYSTNASLVLDTTKLTKSSSSNRAWFSTNVAPRFFKEFTNPEKVKVGIIVPKSLFEKLAVDILIKAAKAFGYKSEIKGLVTLEEALEFVQA